MIAFLFKIHLLKKILYLCQNEKVDQQWVRPEQMIILESTVYPGATRDIFFNKIEKNKKLSIGKNFYLCFSPERISPGKEYDIKYREITKVISGSSSKCVDVISCFYKKIFESVYIAKSLEDAEFTKLFENCYRSVNIGLVNEMKMICDKLGLKIMDIIDTAATKPFGCKYTSTRMWSWRSLYSC